MHPYNEVILETSPLDIKISFFSNIEGRSPLHWHEELEILYPLNGESDILIDGHLHHQKNKQLLVVDSAKIHGTYHYGRDAMFLSVHISKKALEWYLPRIQDYQIVCYPESVTDQEFPAYLEMCSLLKKVTELYIMNSPTFLLESEGLILQLLSKLVAHYSIDSAPLLNDKDKWTAERIRSVLEYVEAHFTEPIALQEVADLLGIGNEYFCRFFKKNMGISFLQYVKEVRMAHVYQELIHTDAPVRVIMERNGFASQKLFNRTFKALYGCTPLQVRKGEASSIQSQQVRKG